MNKIFHYELKRLVCSKFFAGILVICLAYGWQVLSTRTILGVSSTAPFSPWSYGEYLSELLPLLGIILLFLVWNISSGNALRVQSLILATPVSKSRYLLVKVMAAAVAWLAAALCTVLLGLAFLLFLFGGAVPVAVLLLLSAIILLPVLLFMLGLFLLDSRLHPLLPVLLLLILAALSQFFLPASADILGNSFFSDYPLELGILDPPLSLPPSVIVGKLFYALGGVGMFVAALRLEEKKY